MAIVLVVIGLIAGGILVGQDLIKAAESRAQISQIQKIQAATNTFIVKYGYLPGDIPEPYATQFGFIARGTAFGQGDGNGTLTGSKNMQDMRGERSVFWVDLSTAQLIEGAFNTASSATTASYTAFATAGAPGGGSGCITGSNIDLFLPKAKIGDTNYLEIWNTKSPPIGAPNSHKGYQDNNYIALSHTANLEIDSSTYGHCTQSGEAMTVKQAFDIDTKIDDGLPISGKVFAVGLYNDGIPIFASSIGMGAYPFGLWNSGTYDPRTLNLQGPTQGRKTTCFDNNNNPNNPTVYSMAGNSNNVNCSLSFQLQ